MSWSPTALWTSSAATAESTPPESAQSTRSLADLRADALDLLLDHGGGRPRGRRAGDLVEEVLQHVHPVRRVHDLGMELHAVERALGRLERARSASTDDPATTRAPSGGATTESRCDIQTVCSAGVSFSSDRLLDLELRLAELGDAGAVDAAAEVERHQLHAVADAERRDAELEDARIDVRRAVGVHRRGAAAEDDARTDCGRAPPPARSCAPTSSE